MHQDDLCRLRIADPSAATWKALYRSLFHGLWKDWSYLLHNCAELDRLLVPAEAKFLVPDAGFGTRKCSDRGCSDEHHNKGLEQHVKVERYLTSTLYSIDPHTRRMATQQMRNHGPVAVMITERGLKDATSGTLRHL